MKAASSGSRMVTSSASARTWLQTGSHDESLGAFRRFAFSISEPHGQPGLGLRWKLNRLAALAQSFALWPASQKVENALLESAVADSLHVVAPGNIQHLCAGNGVGERLRGARNRVFGSHGDEGGQAQLGDVGAWNTLARA